MSSKTSNNSQQHNPKNGMVAQFVIFGIVALGLLGFAGWYFINMGEDAEMIEPIMAQVTEGEFVSQVLDQGEIQSSENVEIRCEVRARNGSLSVLSVTPEGSRVKAGDFLVQLDSTSFEKELEQQNISMANAETSVIQAETNLASAIASKKEYEEGTFLQSVKTIRNEIYDAESDIKTALQDLQRAKEILIHSTKLQLKGFITKQTLNNDSIELQRQEIKLKKAELSEELALQKLKVLQEITYVKESVQYDADIKAATVKLNSEKKAFAVEKEKLAEIEAMIKKCKIVVPEGVSGQVVYAKESSRGGNDWILEEGTSVRQNQVLVRLPNPEKMEVKALINEQSITRISPNMPVSIKVDALNNTSLKGVVTKVNQYAESSGWMSSSIRKYAVFVRILDPPPALKPGMNASVNIQVQYEPDVLLAPIQTIYGVQKQHFCLAKKGDGWETLEVEIGGDNSQMVYIKSGVDPGTELVMNPGGYKEYMDLPEVKLDTRIEIPEDAASEIAETSSEKAEAPAKKGGKGAKGGGAGGRPSMSMPADGAALIASKDTDGDGKLTKDEIGSPYTFFFDRIDTDSDGFLSEAEADASVKSMKARMKNAGGGGGQRGGPRGGGGR
ncbi:MAG: HlyD family efflux transporter periplasmic adaptor subunit [Mariniblastus sp.]